MNTEFSAQSLPAFTPWWAAILGRQSASSASVLIPRAQNACVLVTGAGGFIGSELVRGLAASGAKQIALLDICEQRLFEISTAMATLSWGDRCTPILGSVCDRSLLAALFSEHRPEIVIHAAALKHVPLMERNPLAAVQTNALGTWYVAQAAEKYGARHMVLVSTDKAVAPHSIMGAAKRIAEFVMLAPSGLRKTAVRLVNVIGSPESVGPLFAEQIARGGPVTVTHPAARRFFLTLREAVGLLAEAIDARSSGLLIPEPGEPIFIAALAVRMMTACGVEVPIEFTQPRPGDKLDELLVSPRERLDGDATSHLRRVVSPYLPNLDVHLRALESAVAQRDGAEMLRLVCDWVPGYQPGALVCASAQPHAEAAAPLP